MIGRSGKVMIVLYIVCLVVLFLMCSTDLIIREPERQIYQIAVIIEDVRSDNYSNFRKGMDLAAPTGTPIYAAAAGTVTTARYSSSAGNWVVINHGNGLQTYYMHASALYVSEGQSVSKGQNIAAVGSTGQSTGPHLHFQVMQNGTPVNPRNYL